MLSVLCIFLLSVITFLAIGCLIGLLFFILIMFRLFKTGVGTPYCIWPWCFNKSEVNSYHCTYHHEHNILANKRVLSWILRIWILCSIVLGIILFINESISLKAA